MINDNKVSCGPQSGRVLWKPCGARAGGDGLGVGPAPRAVLSVGAIALRVLEGPPALSWPVVPKASATSSSEPLPAAREDHVPTGTPRWWVVAGRALMQKLRAGGEGGWR